MSAFIVNRNHIAQLVEAGNPWFEGCFEGINSLDDLGQALTDECVRSVRYRYGDDGDLPGADDWRAPYRHSPVGPYTPAAILRASFSEAQRVAAIAQLFKLIDCYVYQSCEHPEFEKSVAFSYCEALRERLWYELPGYETADWEWKGGR